jgi:hypothetical protein
LPGQDGVGLKWPALSAVNQKGALAFKPDIGHSPNGSDWTS